MGPKAHVPLGFAPLLPLGALGPCGGAHQPTWGWSPSTLGPCGPLGQVEPPGGPPVDPRTPPVVLVHYR